MEDTLQNFELVGVYMHEDGGKRFIAYRFKDLDTSTPEKDDIREYLEEIPYGAKPWEFVRERGNTHGAMLSVLGYEW